MELVINIIGIIIYSILLIIILRNGMKGARTIQMVPSDTYMIVDKYFYFLVFTIITAPFFFPALSLVKYVLYFGISIYIIFLFKNFKTDVIVKTYILFLCWVILRGSYLTIPWQTMMMVIKYTIPLLSLWLAYDVIDSEIDMLCLFKKVNKWMCIYAFAIGGFGCVMFPWFYYSVFGNGIFLTYAGLADYFSSLIVIPIVLFWLTNKFKYIYAAVWIALSSVLESVRTGIGAICLAVVFYFFYRFRVKALPLIFTVGVIFIGVILYVPAVNEKFYGDNAGTVTSDDIVSGDALSMDKMATNGRSRMWEVTMDKFYDKHPIVGAGTGETSHYMKTHSKQFGGLTLLHSDYVQILNDNGIIGIVLLGIFYLSVLLKALRYTSHNHNLWVRVTGITAVCSLAAVGFSMAFDNVVAHSMTSLINPFIFLGFFLKFIDKEEGHV